MVQDIKSIYELQNDFEYMKIKADLAMLLTSIRANRRLSQMEFAKLVGTSQNYISKIENGDFRKITLERMIGFLLKTNRKVDISIVRLKDDEEGYIELKKVA